MTRLLSRALVAAATLATTVVGLAPGASASGPAPCPGGETPCVYLPAGSYSLGNPVTTSIGIAPSTTVLLKHCNSTGTDCDYTTLNLPGLAVSSTASTILTLNVPGEGVGLAGTTPVLYLGLPSVSAPGTLSLGLSLTISGTAFVVMDSSLAPLISCAGSIPVPPLTSHLSGYVGCNFTLTVTL